MRILLALFMGVFLSLASFAQDTKCALLNIYRPANIANSLVSVDLYINDEQVYNLVNNAKLQVKVPIEGRYRISIVMGVRGETYRRRTEKAVEVRCNETAYVRINGGSIFAESVVVVQEEGSGQLGYATVSDEKLTVIDFTPKTGSVQAVSQKAQPIQVSGANNSNACAKMYVYRPNNIASSSLGISVYVDDTEVGVLENKSMLELRFPADGDQRISVLLSSKSDAFRQRTVKSIYTGCASHAYVRVNAGSLFPESIIMTRDGVKGITESNKIPAGNIQVVNIEAADAAPIAQSNPPTQQKTTVTKPVTKSTQQPPAQKAVVKKTPPKKTVTQTPPPKKKATPTRSYGTRTPHTAHSSNITIKAGTSYALIIGVNNYRDYSITDLDQPIADAQSLYDVLVQNYTFEPKNVKFLKDPTKNDITEMLDYYFQQLTPNDNLLIFYAGHGYWDEQFQQGYWLVTDATKSNRGTWLSNGTIRDYMRAIPARHSLLVTDACFGGGIFKSRAAFSNADIAINQLYKLPSRKAMTSGAMSEVPDKSVFVQYLVKRLRQNEDKYLSSEQLFGSFKIAVINNSANGQIPQFGEVKETGDEGGDYIFIRK